MQNNIQVGHQIYLIATESTEGHGKIKKLILEINSNDFKKKYFF